MNNFNDQNQTDDQKLEHAKSCMICGQNFAYLKLLGKQKCEKCQQAVCPDCFTNKYKDQKVCDMCYLKKTELNDLMKAHNKELYELDEKNELLKKKTIETIIQQKEIQRKIQKFTQQTAENDKKFEEKIKNLDIKIQKEEENFQKRVTNYQNLKDVNKNEQIMLDEKKQQLTLLQQDSQRLSIQIISSKDKIKEKQQQVLQIEQQLQDKNKNQVLSTIDDGYASLNQI